MSLAAIVSSSSFFLEDVLADKIKSGQFTQLQLSLALKKGIVSALHHQVLHAEYGSEGWLKYLTVLAKKEGQSANKLAHFYQQNSQVTLAVFWYQQAIKKAYSPASYSLAKLYFSQNKHLLADKLIAIDKNTSEELLLLKIEIAVSMAKITLINQQRSALNKTVKGQALFNQLIKYQVIESPSVEKVSVELLPIHCQISLQMFASSLAELNQLNKLQQQFKQHPLQEYICLNTPRYVDSANFKCLEQPTKAIDCDESAWLNLSKSIDTRYVGLMVPKGGANVHLGILYLDSQDSIDVFAHEVSHLLGFVDEYPLPPQHKICQSEQKSDFSHNIVILNNSYQGERSAIRQTILKQIPWQGFIDDSTPILTHKQVGNKQSWLLGTPATHQDKVGIFSSATCSEKHNLAFKPLFKRTQLTYNQIKFPKLYQEFLKQTPNRYLMPSFHYNIAFSLFKKEEIEQAKLWLIKSAGWESEKVAKQKIRLGDF